MSNTQRCQSAATNFTHIGSFLLLIFLATFRLESITDVTLSLATITVAVAAGLLGIKLYLTIGFLAYFRRYWPEISLFGLFIISCLMSIYVNFERYQSEQLFKYAITPIVVYCAGFIIVSLFALPQNTTGLSLNGRLLAAKLPLALFIFLAILSLWQFIDFSSAQWLGQFFIAAEIWPSTNVNGFFRISTDLGSVLAIISLTCFGLTLFERHSLHGTSLHNWLLICGALATLAGIFSGARVFFLLLFVGVLVMIITRFRHRIGMIVSLTLAMLALFHFAVLFLPYDNLLSFNQLANYLLPLNQGEVIFLTDFIPRLTLEALGERGEIWYRAQQTIVEHWLFGVSNGGFRIGSDNPVHNTHSVLFQPWIDGGIVGVFALTGLIIAVMVRMKRNQVGPLAWTLFTAILVGLCVDFQPDHSLAWIIVMSYLVCFTMKSQCYESSGIQDDLQIEKTAVYINRFKLFSVYITILVIVVTIAVYSWHYSAKQELDIVSRLASVVKSRHVQPIIVIDTAMQQSRKIDQQRQSAYMHLINQVPLASQACLYQYGDHFFVQQLGGSGEKLSGDGELGYLTIDSKPMVIYRSRAIDCAEFLYPDYSNFIHHTWLSDNRYYYLYQDEKPDWSLWINTMVSSSLWSAEQGEYQFSFAAKGQFGIGQWPNLRVCLRDSFDDSILDCQNVSVSSSQVSQYSANLKLDRAALVYLSVTYDNDERDFERNEDRNVWLYPNGFTFGLNSN